MSDNPLGLFLNTPTSAPPPESPPAEAPPENPFALLRGAKLAAPAAEVAPENPFALLRGASGTPAPPPPVEAPVKTQYDLSEVPGAAVSNFFPSAWKSIKETAEAAKEHPLDFVLNLLPSRKHKRDMINTMWDRYGTWEDAKSTMAENPASVLMDVAQLGAFAPETRLGKIAGYADPANLAKVPGKAVELGGKGVGKIAQELSKTEQGVDGAALREMFESGKNVTPGVWEALTKGMDKTKVLSQLKDTLSQLFEDRRNSYLTGMASVEGHDRPIDFAKIDRAVGDAGGVGLYKAPKDKSPGPGYNFEKDESIKSARAEILAEIERFRMLGPEYHTAAGFDKLKQAINQIGDNMRETSGMPSRGSAFANKIADSIVKTVEKEAPEYGAVMRGYHEDSNEIRQLMQEFSVGKPGQSPLPTLKKLQRVFRNHANQGYGATKDFLADVAERTGNRGLMGQLAADEYHSWTPRGLRGVGLGLELPLAAAHAVVNPVTGLPHLGTTLGAGAMMSPRIAGTAAYGAGRAAPYVAPVGRAYKKFGEPALPWIARDINDTAGAVEPERKRGGFFRGRG